MDLARAHILNSRRLLDELKAIQADSALMTPAEAQLCANILSSVSHKFRAALEKYL